MFFFWFCCSGFGTRLHLLRLPAWTRCNQFYGLAAVGMSCAFACDYSTSILQHSTWYYITASHVNGLRSYAAKWCVCSLPRPTIELLHRVLYFVWVQTSFPIVYLLCLMAYGFDGISYAALRGFDGMLRDLRYASWFICYLHHFSGISCGLTCDIIYFLWYVGVTSNNICCLSILFIEVYITSTWFTYMLCLCFFVQFLWYYILIASMAFPIGSTLCLIVYSLYAIFYGVYGICYGFTNNSECVLRYYLLFICCSVWSLWYFSNMVRLITHFPWVMSVPVAYHIHPPDNTPGGAWVPYLIGIKLGASAFFL